MMTGNGDILRDGRMITLLEQCIKKCPFFLIFKPVMENRQVVNSDFQLSKDGIISNIDDDLIDPLLSSSDRGDRGDRGDVGDVSNAERDDSELLSDWVSTNNELVETSAGKCKRSRAEEEEVEALATVSPQAKSKAKYA